MTTQPTPDYTEKELPDSNTLGGTTSTGAGPDGAQTEVSTPETTGLGANERNEADEIARRVNERNLSKDQAQAD